MERGRRTLYRDAGSEWQFVSDTRNDIDAQTLYDVTPSASDNVQGLQAAIADAERAGGGRIVLPPGDLNLVASTTATGLKWHLGLTGDNITLCSRPHARAKLKTTVASAAILHINGAGKLPGGLPLWATQGGARLIGHTPVYNLSGSYVRGVTSLTLATAADAANLSSGDLILIRTGQTGGAATNGQPDSEINEVVSADPNTGVVVVKRATCKPYAQEYFISGTFGLTSTVVTANPAPYGIAKIGDRTLRNIAIEDLDFDSTAGRHDMIGGQIDGFVIRGCRSNNTGAGLHSMGCYRDCHFSDNITHTRGPVQGMYHFSPDSGSSDVLIENNTISGEGSVMIHMHEGTARIDVLNNRIFNAVPGSTNAVSVRGRAYGNRIHGNTILHSGSGAAITVNSDGAIHGGFGSIRDNVIFGSGLVNAITVADPDWDVGPNTTPDCEAPTYGGSTVAPIERLAVWIKSDVLNRRLGRIPRFCFITKVAIHVTTAFDSDGTDNISVGYDASTQALATNTDVSTTGLKSPALGAMSGYNDTARELEAYYTAGGSAPTVGKALVVVEFYRVDQRT
jgi:hypothetical protein